MMGFDESQARPFIKLLHGDEEANVCWQVFHDSQTSADTYNNPVTFHARLQDAIDFFKGVKPYNYGIYCTLNRTDGNGRALENIRGYSFVFADFDNTVIGDLPLEPHLITQRDATHSHCYWRVSGMVTDDIFKRCQKRAAVYLGTDRQVFDPSRVVRVAGSYNCKNHLNPMMYNIVKIEADKPAYTVDEFETGFKLSGEKLIDFDQWCETKSALMEGDEYNDLPIYRERFKTWLKFQADPAVKGNGRSYGVLRAAAMGKDLGIPLAEAQQMMWEHYNDRIQPPYSEQERISKLYKYTERGYRYGNNAVGCRTAAASFLRECGEVPEPTGGWEHNKSLKQPVKKVEPAVAFKGFSLTSFTLNGVSQLMRDSLKNEVYILNGIALKGQLTVIYAAPNVGKTLLTICMLIEAVDKNRIDGKDVFYINADDYYSGIITKLGIFERYNIQMIVPDIGRGDYDKNESQNGKIFKVTDFADYIQTLIDNNLVKDQVIILDTLKKFVDLMDKRGGTEFSKVLRSFSAKGGTVIALAHVNKQPDSNGKKVHAGTTDIMEDFDCAYMLEAKDELNEIKSVCFSNKKARGKVEKEVLYSYSTNSDINYYDLLDSVTRIEAPIPVSQKDVDQVVVMEARELIISGINQKTELIEKLHTALKPEYSKSAISKIIRLNESIEWSVNVGDKNRHIYECI